MDVALTKAQHLTAIRTEVREALAAVTRAMELAEVHDVPLCSLVVVTRLRVTEKALKDACIMLDSIEELDL